MVKTTRQTQIPTKWRRSRDKTTGWRPTKCYTKHKKKLPKSIVRTIFDFTRISQPQIDWFTEEREIEYMVLQEEAEEQLAILQQQEEAVHAEIAEMEDIERYLARRFETLTTREHLEEAFDTECGVGWFELLQEFEN